MALRLTPPSSIKDAAIESYVVTISAIDREAAAKLAGIHRRQRVTPSQKGGIGKFEVFRSLQIHR